MIIIIIIIIIIKIIIIIIIIMITIMIIIIYSLNTSASAVPRPTGALVIGCAARVLHLRDQLAEEVIMDARHPVEAPKSQFSEGRSYGLTITGK
jgi:hypothetical protein